MILTQQVIELVDDMKGDMTNGQAGTNQTLFVKTQTGLQTAVGATDVALVDKAHTTNSVSVTHQITTALGNGSTLVEFEVNNGVDSYNRAVKANLSKVSTLEYNVFHTFTVVVDV